MQPYDPAIEFFAALKQMQSESETNAATSNNNNNNNGNNNNNNNNNIAEDDSENNLCLITHLPLNAFHVRLACGHKFNYEPLFQEVMRQKGRFGVHNYHEPIATHEIKCPYCRSMTSRLLPYIGTTPHPVLKRLTGVNAPAHMCMPGTPCEATKCNANAFYECNQSLYCHKHYQAALKPSPAAAARCLAENQSGKNKGARCKRPASSGGTLCAMHAKCNLVIM
jgi:hypothetical protein